MQHADSMAPCNTVTGIRNAKPPRENILQETYDVSAHANIPVAVYLPHQKVEPANHRGFHAVRARQLLVDTHFPCQQGSCPQHKQDCYGPAYPSSLKKGRSRCRPALCFRLRQQRHSQFCGHGLLLNKQFNSKLSAKLDWPTCDKGRCLECANTEVLVQMKPLAMNLE